MKSPAESSPVTQARIAGLFYLVIIVCGIFGEVFVRGSIVVPGDAAATAQNIMASEGLFRIGFLSDSFVFVSDVVVAVLLYVLLAPVSRTLALIAAGLRLTQTAIIGFNLLNHYAPLLILSGSLQVFDAEGRNALALFFMQMHSHGYDLGLIFFGFNCLVMGYLLVKSESFPTVLGALIAAAGVVYLIGSYTRFLLPGYVETVAPIYVVALVAELSLCLWLLVKGVRTGPTEQRA